VGSDFFQAGETTVRLLSSMGCAQSDLGLRIAASSKTLDLNKFKIVGPSSTPNSKGIVIGAGATNVTVIGGSTNGTSGIESFDYGLLDEGGNTGLWVTSLRCFRARSAGLDIVSDGVTVSNVLVDRTVGAGATQEARVASVYTPAATCTSWTASFAGARRSGSGWTDRRTSTATTASPRSTARPGRGQLGDRPPSRGPAPFLEGRRRDR
jgi:hypothetical protein